MPFLTKDIIGSSSRFTYGLKGDKVDIYSDHDNVVIVQRSDGIRFSVRKEALCEERIEPDLNILVPVKKKRK